MVSVRAKIASVTAPGRAAVGDVELDAEVLVRAAGVVAGGQDDAARGLVLADQAGGRRRRQDAALPHHHPAKPLAGGHAQDDLDRLAVVEASVAADHQGARAAVASGPFPGVEDRLDEVLQVVGLLELLTFLRSPEVPGFCPSKGVVSTRTVIVVLISIVCSLGPACPRRPIRWLKSEPGAP
jgi:hypothetical protein